MMLSPSSQEDYYVTSDQKYVPIRWIAPELVDEVHGNLLVADQTKQSNMWYEDTQTHKHTDPRVSILCRNVCRCECRSEKTQFNIRENSRYGQSQRTNQRVLINAKPISIDTLHP